MDIYQTAQQYNAHFPGFGAAGPVPSAQVSSDAMRLLNELAQNAEMPADGKLRYLDQVVGIMAEVAPASAILFNKAVVENPEQRDLAKRLEVGLAAMAERSPETWAHVQHHTALTSMFYERQADSAQALTNPAKAQEWLTLIVGALGHDIGKIGLDPALLHKSTRVDETSFASALAAYEKNVPDYPEKLHDMIFLQEANAGKIIFAEGAAKADGAAPVIKDLGKDLRRSEEYWLGQEERQSHNAIWGRINAQAAAHIAPQEWLNEREQAALTMSQRGTVTPHEMKVIETHDAMSEAFFAHAPLPPMLIGVREIVSMDPFRDPAHAKTSPLAEIIHTTDVFEALTANRSYRAPYSAEEALKVMQGMAKDGKVNADLLQALQNNGTVNDYAQAFGLKRDPELLKEITAQKEPIVKSWAERLGAPRAAPLSWAQHVQAGREAAPARPLLQ